MIIFLWSEHLQEHTQKSIIFFFLAVKRAVLHKGMHGKNLHMKINIQSTAKDLLAIPGKQF